jgi:four helix bundle protein
MARINDCRELDVYQAAMQAAMLVFELSKKFPAEERFSMIGQVRRSSRSVCTNICRGLEKATLQTAFHQQAE